jgi:MoxR-like ATPase
MEFTNAEERKAYYREKIRLVQEEVAKVVVGQQYMINRILIGLFTGGHILLEGVPGLAKTLTINTVANATSLSFHRIQFTPDLLPSDLLGTMIYNQAKAEFEVKKGPIFAQVILADEVNRSPAKVQAALLECMQEKQVTIGNDTYILEQPFIVLATQNPLEQEGTYPLPEAQIDRFMMKVHLTYLKKEEELEVMRRVSGGQMLQVLQAVIDKDHILAIKDEIQQVTISESLEKYIVELIFASRYPKEYGLTAESSQILYGASTRAAIHMNRGAKAMAFMNGRDYVLPEDIKEIAKDILNHRIILTYEAEAEGITSQQVIDTILQRVEITQG